MKDNLFEMLMGLFETRLSQLQKDHITPDEKEASGAQDAGQCMEVSCINHPNPKSTRIFTANERAKLTKASYQLLKRLQLWGVLDSYLFEVVMNQLEFSESKVITAEETQWSVKTALSPFLNDNQMAFLDLVLCQTKSKLIAH